MTRFWVSARPPIAGLLLITATWVSAFHQQSFGLTPFEAVFGAVLAGAALWAILTLLWNQGRATDSLLLFFVFGIWTALDLLVAVAAGLPLLFWARLFLPPFIFAMSAVLSYFEFPTRAWVYRVYGALVALGLVVLAVRLSSLRGVSLIEIADLQTLRRYGGDFFGPVMLCLTLPLLAFHRPRARWITVIVWSSVFLALTGTLISYTRTYWISTSFALVILVYLARRFARVDFGQVARRAVLTVGLGSVAALMLFPANIRAFALGRVTDILRFFAVPSLQERAEETRALIEASMRNPLTLWVGNGFGAPYSYTFVHPVSGQVFGAGPAFYAHNYYAYLIFSVGIVGLGLFVGACGVFLRSAYHAMVPARVRLTDPLLPISAGIATGVANLLLASVTAPQLMNVNWALYFGILVGIGANAFRHLGVSSASALDSESATSVSALSQ